MRISLKARSQYQIEDDFFKSKEGYIKFPDIYSVRLFVDKINQKRNLLQYPELAVRASEINGISLIYDIYHHIFDLYQKKKVPNLYKDLLVNMEDKIGKTNLDTTLERFIAEFPPPEVYNKTITPKQYLKEKTAGVSNKEIAMKELIHLWLENTNPAFTRYQEMFDDEPLEKKTEYNKIMEQLDEYFKKKEPFGPKDQYLIELMKTPEHAHPYSIKEQLEFIAKEWRPLIDSYYYKILSALDLFAEEEKMRGLGAGESFVYTYDGLEENYTPDADWMPNVVMIAKNTYVWLDQLSKKYNRSIARLDQIPDEELEQLARWGFNALWLIGLWERSPASKTLKRWCGNPEAEASAYSLFDYVIATDIGGEPSYQNLKSRALKYGIRLASDMVPNHTGIDSKWTREHPEWYISLPYPPFPSYSYSGSNLCGDPNIGIYLEDHYFDRSDAAVTFKHVDRDGTVRYIYHGNDGTSFPWNDTAQLNYLLPEVREAVIQMILHVARKFPIIRFDAAMTLTRKHYQRLWFPPPGSGGDIPSRAGHGLTTDEFYKAMPKEFWREVVERVNAEMPDTLLLAEAFWLLEGFFVRTLGMHRVYNSAFMNMLRDEDNAKYRTVIKNTLEFDPEILKRFVNFMNNPDEETAVKQFGKGEKYFGICLLLTTLPGLPMFGHGQIEGYAEKYGMEYRRAYWDEEPDLGLINYHETVIFPLMKKRYLFSEVDNFLLYDFFTVEGYVNENVFCYSNGVGQERSLIIYNNSYSSTAGWIRTSAACLDKETGKLFQKSLAEGLLLSQDERKYWIFKDQFTGLEYIRRSSMIHSEGLHVILGPYQAMAIVDSREVTDNEWNHYSILNNYLDGRGVPSIEESRQKLVYGDLHRPLQQILAKDVLAQLAQVKKAGDIEELIQTIRPLVNGFYTEAKKHLDSEVDITELVEEVLQDLEGYLLFRISGQEIFVLNQLDDFMMLAWVSLKVLGKIKEKTDRYALASRSLIEEWLIDKIIEESYGSIREGLMVEVAPLVKVLVKQQLLMERFDESPVILLRNIIRDSEVQSYIKVNRHGGVIWYNKEQFELLARYLCLTAVLIVCSKDKNYEDRLEKIQVIKTLYEAWKELSQKAEYKLERLLSIGE